jgi:hypothetical protein
MSFQSFLKRLAAVLILISMIVGAIVLLHLLISNWWVCASLMILVSPIVLVIAVLYKYTRVTEADERKIIFRSKDQLNMLQIDHFWLSTICFSIDGDFYGSSFMIFYA